ncbi:hypothetical protein DDP32_03785 [Helicobacter pylori]|nr:hypothetical protein DDP32_03785 [Helicobacter pylori]
MYLEYCSIKRFFFFVIWEKFCDFFDFRAFCFVWWCWNSFSSFETRFLKLKIRFLKLKIRFLKGIGGYLIKIGCGEWI